MGQVREVSIKDWEDFESEVARIVDGARARRASSTGYVSSPLFRGHTDQSWPLLTTLERWSTKRWSVTDYYKLMLSVLPAVNSLTTKTWPLDRDLDVDEDYHGPPPGYEFMIYLRHHGFPSPLLDWTRSPYVAAFFAFAARSDPAHEAVAVYAFLEHAGQGKEWFGDEARIIGLVHTPSPTRGTTPSNASTPSARNESAKAMCTGSMRKRFAIALACKTF